MYNVKKVPGILITLPVLFFFLFTFPGIITTQPAAAAENTDIQSVKGNVKGFADPRQSKTISLDLQDKGIVVFKYDDTTEFKNFDSLLELKGEAAVIEYRVVGSDKLATSIKKAYVQLPEGIREIKTDEVASLVEKGSSPGNYLLVDARPSKMYAEGHIPTAVSIPVTALEKEGANLLPSDKNKLLIFYCGGPT